MNKQRHINDDSTVWAKATLHGENENGKIKKVRGRHGDLIANRETFEKISFKIPVNAQTAIKNKEPFQPFTV